MKPYCGERSIEFLCDYVDSWILVLEMMENIIKKHYQFEPYFFNMDHIKDIVLTITILNQAIRELRK